MSVVLTGATGFLGGELLVRLVEQTDEEVVCLVRSPERLEQSLAMLLRPGSYDPARIRAVAFDLERPPATLDLDAEAFVHCAASVQFTLPLEDARRINVDGTRAMLALAHRAPSLERFVHVSTAYVAGDRPGVCREDERDVGQAHRNTYEQSKLEAEEVVAASGLPWSVLRPSIVVGDSQTGWTPSFNVIYWPLQAFARGLFPVVPGVPDAVADVVCADVVADGLFDLVCGERRSGTFHAVAGENAPMAGELATLAATSFDAPVPEFVPPGSAPEIEDRAGAFLPYFRVRGRFAVQRGWQGGPLADSFDALMAYARAARWGRNPLPRWAATEAPS